MYGEGGATWAEGETGGAELSALDGGQVGGGSVPSPDTVTFPSDELVS